MKEFLEKLTFLDNIRQWEERDSVIKETVSQHSFKVAAIAVYLIQSVENNVTSESVNLDKFTEFKYGVISYAVTHDFDEAVIGRDISHTVKYNKFNGDKIRQVLNEFVERYSDECDLPIIKPSDEVKVFVKLCDWIALRTFIERNRRLGVSTFDEEYEYCNENIEAKSKEISNILKERFNIIYLFLNAGI